MQQGTGELCGPSPAIMQGLLCDFFSGTDWTFTNSIHTDSFLLPCSQAGDFLPSQCCLLMSWKPGETRCP